MEPIRVLFVCVENACHSREVYGQVRDQEFT